MNDFNCRKISKYLIGRRKSSQSIFIIDDLVSVKRNDKKLNERKFLQLISSLKLNFIRRLR